MWKLLFTLTIVISAQFDMQPVFSQLVSYQNENFLQDAGSSGIGFAMIELTDRGMGIPAGSRSENNRSDLSRKIYFSYLGEMITHPGLKLGIEQSLAGSKTLKDTRRNISKTTYRELGISVSAGVFNHHRYQTGFLLTPEFYYSRKTAKNTEPGRRSDYGSRMMFGLAAGYLSTVVPNTWETDAGASIKQVHSTHGYFLTSGSVSVEWERIMGQPLPFSIFLKPQIHYAIPHFPNGLFYFMLEAGFKYEIGGKQ